MEPWSNRTGSVAHLSLVPCFLDFFICLFVIYTSLNAGNFATITLYLGRCFRLVCGIGSLMMAKGGGMVALPTCYPKITCRWKRPSSVSRVISRTFHSSLKGMAIIHHPCWGPNRLPIFSPIPVFCLQILLVLRHGRPPESPLKCLLFWKPYMGRWTRRHENWVCSR
jgi:hypothetical protein